MGVKNMRFDWYQCTIQDDPVTGIPELAKLGHELRPADGLARRYHYNQGFQVYHHLRGVVATVLAGGMGMDSMPSPAATTRKPLSI